eukprot:CAMPEP_0204532662 /NCGR_PEP_ID=MMETSP0661-20131031/11849_1 /ASSEMBLY_ACC=CAM_ASM_000606 /TAXON_ID=109239 /ORGANISM="Alexandrium margalefi, Strain AMGDE01CS-322" /LENGTH=288 /DNA_ID=CAMNT_0051538923 /DNA_START=141 /DNA_END=1007 /DNA_ORIENTATION=+
MFVCGTKGPVSSALGPQLQLPPVVNPHAHDVLPELLGLTHLAAASLAPRAAEGPRPRAQEEAGHPPGHHHGKVLPADVVPALSHRLEVDEAVLVVRDVGPRNDHRLVLLARDALLLHHQVQAALPMHQLVQGPPQAVRGPAVVAAREALLPVPHVRIDVLGSDLVRVGLQDVLHGLHRAQRGLDDLPADVRGHEVVALLALRPGALEGYVREDVRMPLPHDARAWEHLIDEHGKNGATWGIVRALPETHTAVLGRSSLAAGTRSAAASRSSTKADAKARGAQRQPMTI